MMIELSYFVHLHFAVGGSDTLVFDDVTTTAQGITVEC